MSQPNCSLKIKGAEQTRDVKRQVSKRLVSKHPVSKRQVSKRLVSKCPVFKFDILIKKNIGIAKFEFLFRGKECVIFIITSDYGDIWHKKPFKIENKTQPSLCLQTWLQQNLRISTNHKYRIYIWMFFATGCLEDLTFCKPDIL